MKQDHYLDATCFQEINDSDSNSLCNYLIIPYSKLVYIKSLLVD